MTSADWALLVTIRTNLGMYETEEVFSGEKAADMPVTAVAQKPVITCSGSHVYTASGEGHNTVDALSDGDLSTEWVPFAPIGSQTIRIDMRQVKPVYGIRITLGRHAELPPYRIEGSCDKENWTIPPCGRLLSQRTMDSVRFVNIFPENTVISNCYGLVPEVILL